jgi:hypothetical protein
MNHAKAAASRVLGRRPASAVATSASKAIPKMPSVSLSFDVYPERAINVKQYNMFNERLGAKTSAPTSADGKSVAHFKNIMPPAYRPGSAPVSPAATAARSVPPSTASKIRHSLSFNDADTSRKELPTPWTVGGALKSTKPVPPRFLPADRQSNLQNIKDRYKFSRELGRGKFGVVYEAVDLQTEEKVAVKVLDKLQCGPAQCNHELKMMEQIKSQVSHDRLTPIKGMYVCMYTCMNVCDVDMDVWMCV